MKKRLLSIVLTLCMMLTLLPISAMAEEAGTSATSGEITAFSPLDETEISVPMGKSAEKLPLPQKLTATVRTAKPVQDFGITAPVAEDSDDQPTSTPPDAQEPSANGAQDEQIQVQAAADSVTDAETGNQKEIGKSAELAWEENIVDIPVTWELKSEYNDGVTKYDKDAEGDYVFTPMIEEYTVNTELPKITVTVGTPAVAAREIQTLAALDSDITEQFSLATGGTYYFDLSSEKGNIGTVNTVLPDQTLHYVPFTYAGTVNAYSLDSNSRGKANASITATASDRSLFVGDYVIGANVSWDSLNTNKLIFGKAFDANYTLRSLSSGSHILNGKGAQITNEWDRILDKSEATDWIKNRIEKFSWGQDTAPDPMYDGNKRAARGDDSIYNTPLSNACEVNLGFRPALEVLNPATLTADGLKAVTLKLNGSKLNSSTEDIKIICAGNSFKAPSGEGLTVPDGKTFDGWKDMGSNAIYAAGAEVPNTVTSLTAQWEGGEQFSLATGGTYYFDLSSEKSNIGTVSSKLPDTTLHYVPFTYAGTVNAYSLTSAMVTTEEYANANKSDRSLFVGDHVISYMIKWDDLDAKGLIFGKNFDSNYTLRSLSAASSQADSKSSPANNEWDQILNKSKSTDNESGWIKNWGRGCSWAQDASQLDSTSRTGRGFWTASFWSKTKSSVQSWDIGFRPALEVLNPATLTADGLKVVTLKLNGGKLNSSTEDIKIICAGNSFKAPSGEGLTVPDGKTFDGWKDTGSNAIYAAGADVPNTVTSLTAQWKALIIEIAVPTAVTGLKWTGIPLTGVIAGTGYDLDETYQATAVGNYSATATLQPGYAWNDATTAPKNISWSIEKADGPHAPTTLSGVAPSSAGGTDGKIIGTSAAMEYADNISFTDAQACTDTPTTGLSAGTYYVRLKSTSTHEAGAYTAVIVAAGVTKIPIPTAVTKLKWTGSEQIGVSTGIGYDLSGTVQATAVDSYTATATLQPGYAWNDGTTAPQSISWSIAKADGPTSAPTGLSGVAPSSAGGTDGKITGTTAAMEYANNIDFSGAQNCTSTETGGLSVGTYYVRLKATATHEAGAYTAVIVAAGVTKIPVPTANTGLKWTGNEQIGVSTGIGYDLSGTVQATAVGNYTATATPQSGYAWNDGTTAAKNISWSIAKADGPTSAPTGLSGVAPSSAGGTDGKITGTTVDMEYANNIDFSGAQNCTAPETGSLSVGTYYVRLKATATHEAGAYTTVTVAPDPDIAIVDVAKDAAQNADYANMTQAEATNEDAIKAALKSTAQTEVNNGDITIIINGGYTPPIAGTSANPRGTDGIYTFTVTVSKGGQSDTTTQKTITITATPYTGVSDVQAVDTAKTALIDGAVNVAFGASPADKTAAVQSYVNSLLTGDAAGVTATVTYNEGTGKYDVTLTKGSVNGTKSLSMTVNESSDPDIAIVEAAKTAAQNAGYANMTQAEATNEDAIKAALKSIAETAVSNGDITITINGSYTPPIAGTSANFSGTDGSYTFTITVSKGSQSETTKQKTVIITATAYTGGTGGGGGGSSNTSAPSNKPTEPVTGSTKNNATVDGTGNVNVSLTDKNITDAIADAKAEAAKKGVNAGDITAVIHVITGGQSASTVTVNLPKTTQKQVIDNKISSVQLVIDRPDLTIGINLAAVTEINRQAKADVQLSATRIENTTLSGNAKAAIGDRPAYDFQASYGDEKSMTDFGKGSVSVEIPYTLQKGEIAGNVYAVYVDAKGKVTYLTDSSYDAGRGMVVFSTSHFSIYGIAYKDSSDFADIDGHWAKDDILFVANRGLMSGTSSATFSPNGSMTRGMFVTALGRLTGVDVSTYTKSSFTDVKENSYYISYIEWGVKNNILVGIGGGKFDPDGLVTREQMAAIMDRYTTATGLNLPEVYKQNTFADNAKIGVWAAPSVKRIQMAGIIQGKSNNLYSPQGVATRAEVSAVLRRFVELTSSTGESAQ